MDKSRLEKGGVGGLGMGAAKDFIERHIDLMKMVLGVEGGLGMGGQIYTY